MSALRCLQPHICHGPNCWVCGPDDEPTCPDCTETSRCIACGDDFNYHHDKDNE